MRVDVVSIDWHCLFEQTAKSVPDNCCVPSAFINTVLAKCIIAFHKCLKKYTVYVCFVVAKRILTVNRSFSR